MFGQPQGSSPSPPPPDSGMGTALTGPPTESKSLPAVARPFLDAVSSGESPSYNIRYDGGKGATFDSFEDHPRKLERITSGPQRGKLSDAAGRYQMISTTWDRIAQEHGLTDFSPENQDFAAWQLANSSYSKLTKGRDLSADLQAGHYDDVAKVMSSEWASIGKDPKGFVGTLRRKMQS